MKNKLFLILCLHRSGSSATAGVLHHLDVNMGDKLLHADQSNPKGHFENVDYVSINNLILHLNGGSWRNPPQNKILQISNHLEEQIQAFLSTHVKPVWGLKDPRSLLTLEIWKPYLDKASSVTYIFVHRPFEASVCSLARRNNIKRVEAIDILTPYLKNKYDYRHFLNVKKQDIVDVHFEDLINNPVPFIGEINKRLGREPHYNLAKVKEFLDASLVNF